MKRRRAASTTPTFAEQWFDMRADYNMATSSRFRRSRTGVSGTGRTADYHYRTETGYLRMVELARDMDRNDSIVGSIVDRAVQQTVGDELTPEPKTGDDKLDTELKANWTDYAETPEKCDLAGELAHPEIVQLSLRQTLVDGDVVDVPTRDGPIEMIEGHRLRTPNRTKRNVVLGILLDEFRRRKQYWVTRDEVDPSAVVKVADVRPIDTRDRDGNRQVFHLYNPRRITQTRGVTALAPIVDVAGMFEDIQFAKLVQQQVVSCFAIFRHRETDWRPGGQNQAQGEQTTTTLDDGSTRLEEGLAPGMQIPGDPGERLEGFSPNVPNPEYFDQARMILQIIGVNLGLPLVMVLMDASETNFSGWRGAVDLARAGFRSNQRFLVRRLLRPDYKRNVRRWMAVDPAIRRAAGRSNIKIFNHKWNLPAWPYIQPLADAQADLLRVRNCLTSASRRAAERNIDWDDLSAEICRDNALLIERAHKTAEALNEKYPGLGVTWREVACLPTPDGVTIQAGGDEPAGGKKGAIAA